MLAVREDETSVARVDFAFAHSEVERLILDAAKGLTVGETVTLRSEGLPFEMRLISVIGMALASFCAATSKATLTRCASSDSAERSMTMSQLSVWASGGRTSVLVLECDDFQHANFGVSVDAVEIVLAERPDRPDIIVYVETDASPWSAWVFKDGERLGNDTMRNRDGGYQ